MSIEEHPRLSDWLAIDAGKLWLRTGKVDIGQRVSTALVGVAQSELALPLDLIDVEPVRTGASPDEGMTSGSNSIEQSGRAVRLACATLREAIIARVVERVGGAPEDWQVDETGVSGPGTNRPLPLLDLAADVDLDIPIRKDAKVARPGAAEALPMRGLRDLVTGAYRFLQDLDVPDMLHARVVRPPHAKARLKTLDDAAVSGLEARGLRVIRDGSFLAVAGPEEWSVIRAAARLFTTTDWDMGEGLDPGDVDEVLRPGNAIRLNVEDGVPQMGGVIPDPLANPDYSARYTRPFTMHGSLAPSAAMALCDGKFLRITTHSQGVYVLRDSIAESLDLAPEAVELTYMPGSGCYGHNGADDAAYDAALIARALPGKPILLKWTRDDEHAWEPFGPASAVDMAARLAENGDPEAFSADAIGGTFRGRPRSGPDRAGPAKLLGNHFKAAPIGPHRAVPNMNRHGGLHRNLTPIYDIPQMRLVKNLIPEAPLRSSALRCLGAALNVFAIESFVDEIVQDKGLDPFDYRKRNLSDARAIAVIDALEKDLESRPKPAAGGRGIAYAQYKNAMTRVAVAVDLTVTDTAQIRLSDVIIVADAGRVVDRDGLVAQLEGGFLQAASWALYEEVTWDRDGITSRDWDSYPVLRFPDVPKIDVVVLDRQDEKSVGAGEAAPGPTLAAIANAVHDATGLRLRRLPFTPDALTSAALES
ncbi:molybdopterin cofactor-binding domain-containing protein [Tropicimonas sp. S265A]|uniref:molybdopterin cofactor-binding domain-containing protein n=1 Tax=Tropicimonas sp. S265A TaxID=3415134 RepID=UPI003C7D2D45